MFGVIEVFYNQQRLRQTPGYLSPMQSESSSSSSFLVPNVTSLWIWSRRAEHLPDDFFDCASNDLMPSPSKMIVHSAVNIWHSFPDRSTQRRGHVDSRKIAPPQFFTQE
jgi:hypothetical protein